MEENGDLLASLGCGVFCELGCPWLVHALF